MWLVPPRKLCDRHLLGEHVEMHMFAGCIRLGKSIDGYVKKGLVETRKIKSRHDALAREMKRRGFRHVSVLRLKRCPARGRVDPFASWRELERRCPRCRKLR